MKTPSSSFWSQTLVFFLGLMLCLPSHAERDVAGIKFDDQASVAGQVLTLNGAGVRVKMIIKVYAVGLYVAHKETTTEAILNQPGAKSIHIVLLRDVSADRMADALLRGVVDNLSELDQHTLQARLDALEHALRGAGEVTKGGVIRLDYVPDTGTHLSLDGKALSKDIEGEDFYHALLKIWLGEHPSDHGLKAELLGRS